MYNKQAFEGRDKNGCGPMGGRRGFGGQWGRGKFGGFWGRHGGGFSQTPVNIEETDYAYIISLFAAGINKEDVKLSVKDDVLTISYQAGNQDDNAEQKGNFTYQEYRNGSFERAFQLNNKVLTDSISASYADGILKVVLPKNPETNKPAQTINVA